MLKLVVKAGCGRCCKLVSQLSETNKDKIVSLHSSDCCGFIGLGDVVEWLIHAVDLHKVWAKLHGQKADWVCPGCMRRKTWLNKLWYFGKPETKALWVALVDSKELAIDAEYPFFVCQYPDGGYAFSAISDAELSHPKLIDALLAEGSCDA